MPGHRGVGTVHARHGSQPAARALTGPCHGAACTVRQMHRRRPARRARSRQTALPSAGSGAARGDWSTSACSSMTAGTATPGTTMRHPPARQPLVQRDRPTTTAGPAPAASPFHPPRRSRTRPAGEPDGARRARSATRASAIPTTRLAGNGGYQIDSYDIDSDLRPGQQRLCSRPRQLTGTVTSDEGLTQFNLDLQPTMTVTAVDVERRTARPSSSRTPSWSSRPAELVAAQAALTVEVTYAGEPDLIPGGTVGSATAAGTARTPAARSRSASRTARRPGTRSTNIRPTPPPSP